jgi:TPR repeat protein
MRVITLWSTSIAVCIVIALLLALPWPRASDPAASMEAGGPESPADICLRLSENPAKSPSAQAVRERNDRQLANCKLALAAEPTNTHVKVALAHAMPDDQSEAAVALLREAAAQNDADAWYELYEWHKSWERGDLDRVQLVTRAEAERALHRAAELGHPFATQMLAILLDRGDIVKRDPAAARYWADRALANPAKTANRGDLQVLVARLLVKSDQPDERARGLDMLENLSQIGTFGARTNLARAIRSDNPVRARALLEQALRADVGGARPLLAEMLIAGEGGPADPARALSLLTASADTTGVDGLLGQLYLEGKLVPRDVQKAVRLIDMAGTWDLDARLQVLQLLAANPDVRASYPKRTLYYAVQDADAGEPGMMAALIDLKLSQNPQFQDKAGGCKLARTAAARGDQAAARRLPECAY